MHGARHLLESVPRSGGITGSCRECGAASPAAGSEIGQLAFVAAEVVFLTFFSFHLSRPSSPHSHTEPG